MPPAPIGPSGLFTQGRCFLSDPHTVWRWGSEEKILCLSWTFLLPSSQNPQPQRKWSSWPSLTPGGIFPTSEVWSLICFQYYTSSPWGRKFLIIKGLGEPSQPHEASGTPYVSPSLTPLVSWSKMALQLGGSHPGWQAEAPSSLTLEMYILKPHSGPETLKVHSFRHLEPSRVSTPPAGPISFNWETVPRSIKGKQWNVAIFKM